MSQCPCFFKSDKFSIGKRRVNTLKYGSNKIVKPSLTIGSNSSTIRVFRVAREKDSETEPFEEESGQSKELEENAMVSKREAADEWREAMKRMIQMPNGLPASMRKRIWQNLADQYIEFSGLDWEYIKQVSFSPKINSDDVMLDQQIVKDLHRTGCEQFGSEVDRATLKKVLLAYARWNKKVGYCQGLNIIAALILYVTNKDEEIAFKVMIFLVDSILPDSFFARNLQALSVDMYIFRQLLAKLHPELGQHLDKLQEKSSQEIDKQLERSESKKRRCFEPPLTNVYTMQWFLTLFATSLPRETVLHVWDAIMFEGSEVYIRCTLAIFMSIADKLLQVTTADMFYAEMSHIVIDLLEGNILSRTELMEKVYSFGRFPIYGLKEMRNKYMFNISPFIKASDLLDDEHFISEYLNQTSQQEKKNQRRLFSIMNKKRDLRSQDKDELCFHDSGDKLLIQMKENFDESRLSLRENGSKLPYNPSEKLTIISNFTDEEDTTFIQKVSCPKNKKYHRLDKRWTSLSTNESHRGNREIFARRIYSLDLTQEHAPAGLSASLNEISSVSPGSMSNVRKRNLTVDQVRNPSKTDINELKKNYRRSKNRPRLVTFESTGDYDDVFSLNSHEDGSENSESMFSEPCVLENQKQENVKIDRLAKIYKNQMNLEQPVNHLILGRVLSNQRVMAKSDSVGNDIMEEWNRRNTSKLESCTKQSVHDYISNNEGSIICSTYMPEEDFPETSDGPEDSADMLLSSKKPPWADALKSLSKRSPIQNKTIRKRANIGNSLSNGAGNAF